MAKAIEFVADNLKFSAAITKVDRDKVYGFIELNVKDDLGKPCNLGSNQIIFVYKIERIKLLKNKFKVLFLTIRNNQYRNFC